VTPQPVPLPRVNANDDSAILSAWLVQEWEPVTAHQPIALIETTKAVVELESTAEGLLVHAANTGDEIAIGEPVAYLMTRKDRAAAARLKEARRQTSTTVDTNGGPRPISAKARQAMTRHGLSLEDVPGSGPVRERDVAALIALREKEILSEREQREQVERLTGGETDLILFGAALQAEVVLDCLDSTRTFGPVALIDDRPRAREVAGLPVLSAERLGAIRARGVRLAHVCIGDGDARLACGERLRREGFELVNVIHPGAIVATSATVGRGVFVGPFALVGPHARIGDLVQINNAATIAHHSVVERGARISDGAHVGGEVTIGARVLLGIGVAVNTRVRIGADSIVVSGVTVYGDVPPRSLVRADGRSYPRSKT
jgi:UDP-perosamine 4-acetyltransferase